MDEFDHVIVNEDVDGRRRGARPGARRRDRPGPAMAEVLLGVSGGIAAYKAVDVLRILQRRGHVVTRRHDPGRPALRRARPRSPRSRAARWASTCSAPRGGRATTTSSSPAAPTCCWSRRRRPTRSRGWPPAWATGCSARCYLAFDGPVLIAPAMNTRMYLHPATADNLALLRRARGPGGRARRAGLLADGEVGVGRLADPADIADAVEARLAGAGTLAGRRVLVSAGGTREPIDPVRYVGNRSSGRMGWAVAEAARRRGAEVTVLASNVDLPRHPDIRYVDAPTAADLHRAARAALPLVRRPGDGRRRGRLPPGDRPRDGQDRQGAEGAPRASSSSRRRTSSSDLAARAGAPGAGGLRGRARPGRPRARARQARAQGPRPDRPQRRLGRRASASARGENEITIIGPDGEERAAAHEQGRLRRAHPRRGAAPAGPAR